MSELRREDATKYLGLYLGDADWEYHLGILYRRLRKKYSGDKLGEEMREQIACAVLLPFLTSTKVPDEPSELLYSCRFFHQFEEKDWWPLLYKIIKEDEKIESNRGACLALGRVEKVKLHPITRQAFNWMYEAAETGGYITPQNKAIIVKKIKYVIYAYGGTVISNIFLKHKNHLSKVVNWNTNYFIERIIFDIYSLDQVIKIKKKELANINEKLVVGI